MAVGIPEHFEDIEEMLRAMLDGMRKDIWVALPVEVAEDSEDMHTVKLKIGIKAEVTKPDGTKEYVDYPQLEDVPISFPSGGGATLTFPIKKKMTGYVLMSSRGFDHWHEKGDVQKAAGRRMHHMTDGLAFHPIRNDPKKLKGVSKTATQMRSDDVGSDDKPKHFVSLDPAAGKIVTSVDSGKHVTTHETGKGITHESSVAVNMKAPKGTFDMALTVKGTLHATKAISSEIGVKAPLLDGAPGPVDEGTPTS